MRYKQLGNSGLTVSAIGLGTNAFGKRADAQTSTLIIEQAIHHGVTFIDTANIYAATQSETIIGNAILGKRNDIVLTTKAGLPNGKSPNHKGSSRHHLMQELEASLTRLQTDYVDLYQIHTFDPNTPLEETLRCLEDMITSGKVRYIGCSNYHAWELMKALGISERLGLSKYISQQVSYSLADRTPERELIPLCIDQGIGIIPYFPLAGGILTGKYESSLQTPEGSRAQTDPSFNRFLTEPTLKLSQDLQQIANQYETTPSNLAIAWLLHQPVVSTVIVGATKTTQLVTNLEALDFSINVQLMEQLNNISEDFRHGEPFASYRI
ncbi:MAG: aldo/keto reductase [Candidatus Pristimantibacillus lignocellulolyticus]|uniref:Aldo/keto reductase n=1 Tax=Candidatus Pristimantibacillus lignocellulolyticus TaxID=2994561 RepID=A0A9J6ZHL7_9BACL|nr:MAG: aldo/keto reductase [Candidatus Pristimantibacillus lignocellulolyticus]